MKVAWLGTGVMGGSMMMHIKNAGHEVKAFNRTKAKALKYESEGILVCDSIEECVKDVDVIFSIVSMPKDVEDVFNKLYGNTKENAIFCDMTTSSPSLAMKMYEKGKEVKLHVCDAPVSGGDVGAQKGTLSIMFGGDKEDFDVLKPLFDTMGTARYMGSAGAGQHTKCCNQIAVAGAVSAVAECIHYADVNGLDREKMLEAIAGGAAGSWQINNIAPKIVKEDYRPGFFIEHFVKDMHIIQDNMTEHNETLEMLNTVCHMYEEMMAKGSAKEGTQAIIKYYNK